MQWNLRFKSRAFILASLLCVGFVSSADSIRVGDKTYDNVYVVKGGTMYYVSLPEDGTVLNVSVSEVDPASVKITENQETRRQLFEQWSQKNRERLKIAAPVQGEEKPVEAPAKNPNEPKRITMTAPPQASAPSYDPQRQALMQQIRNKNAMNTGIRRQREADKFNRLNSVRVYTSADGGGAGGGYGARSGVSGGGMGMSGGRR